jgi:hypothetical protein
VPGIKPDDRRLVADHVIAPPTPRAGTVRGTMGKPQLPRRRAQEHIAPQLRGGPAPRQDAEYPTGHDPGLMAAFQRGISLAEAQQHLEPEDGEPATAAPLPVPSPRREFGHMEPAPVEAAHMDPTHMDSTHMGSTHTGSTHMDSAHPDTAATARTGRNVARDTAYPGTATSDTGSSASASLESRPVPSPDPSASFGFDLDPDARHTDAAPTTDAASLDVSPMERPHISEPHGLDHDRTTHRHDGSAPAG